MPRKKHDPGEITKLYVECDCGAPCHALGMKAFVRLGVPNPALHNLPVEIPPAQMDEIGASSSLTCDSEAEAIAEWNRRSSPLVSEVERLREVLRDMCNEFDGATYDMSDGSQSRQRRELIERARSSLLQPTEPKP